MVLPNTSGRSPGGRNGASIAYDPLTGSITLFGGGRLGRSASAQLFPRDTWSWDVNGWRRHATSTAPPALTDAAFAYDETTGSAILFGGIGARGATWRWNGLTWSRLAPRHHPPPNAFTSAAFDPRRGSIVLVAVCCQNSPAGSDALVQAWAWLGTDWTLLPGRSAPTVFRAPLITYDPSHGALLLLTQGLTPPSDTTDQITTTSSLWSFDGTTWRRLPTPTSPPFDPIRDRLGYDPASKRVVLFQGGDLPTWTWNGRTWRKRAASGPLFGSALVTDATADRILLFGGPVGSADFSTVWTFRSGYWTKATGR